jgi:XRE family aerobic/anaerobic benzoate catabolism transcriptional regulator
MNQNTAATAITPKEGGKTGDADETRDPFLLGLGERVRTLRARRGMTRKALALEADVSERYLAGAGKSTLGRMLADELKVPFVELNRVIEQLAGCPPSEIHALYGASAYRRYEHRALSAVIAEHTRAVIASPGGLVSEAATLSTLLAHCFAVWLQATPEDHMHRVIAQGDLRPMAGNAESMDDLRRILAGRSEFYGRADMTFNTSGLSLAEAYLSLRDRLAARLSAE